MNLMHKYPQTKTHINRMKRILCVVESILCCWLFAFIADYAFHTFPIQFYWGMLSGQGFYSNYISCHLDAQKWNKFECDLGSLVAFAIIAPNSIPNVISFISAEIDSTRYAVAHYVSNGTSKAVNV